MRLWRATVLAACVVVLSTCALSTSVLRAQDAGTPAAPEPASPAPQGEPAQTPQAPSAEPQGEPAQAAPAEPAQEPAPPEPAQAQPTPSEPQAAQPQGAQPQGAQPQGTQPAQAQPAQAQPAASEPEEKPRREPLRVAGAVTLEPPTHEFRLIPPYMRDRRGNVTTTAVFPFYFERRTPTDLERLIIPYYYRRGPKLNVDVALGLVWSLRGPDRNTFVLPPLYTHRSGKDWAFGLAPLFFTGIFSGRHHTLIPALLTWINGDEKKRHTLIGPYFEWKDEKGRFKGVFPLYWDKADDVDRFRMVPPFYFNFADDDPYRVTTVVPPVYVKRRKDLNAWGIVPFAFRKDTPELSSVTVPLALFHYATGPEEFRLVTPLLAYLDSTKEGRAWVTPIYQRKRSDKNNFDAVAPFFFRAWDERDVSSSLVVPPIYWHWEDPANDSTVVFPFVGRWYRDGISSTWLLPVIGRYKSLERDEQTWWVAPTFHYAWTETSWQFNIHPFFYLKRSPEKSHLAVAPFYFDFKNNEAKTHRFTLFPVYWDFANYAKQKHARVAFPLYWDFANERKQRRRIIGFPLYWDFRDARKQVRTAVAFPLYFRTERGERVRHFSLNTFYETKKDPTGAHWQFHFFPLTAVGGGDREKWWSVLYGLAGYERRGSHRRMKLFWIPFKLE